MLRTSIGSELALLLARFPELVDSFGNFIRFLTIVLSRAYLRLELSSDTISKHVLGLPSIEVGIKSQNIRFFAHYDASYATT
jgi:hypothetical protein